MRFSKPISNLLISFIIPLHWFQSKSNLAHAWGAPVTCCRLKTGPWGHIHRNEWQSKLVFVPGKPFSKERCLWVRPGAYLKGEHLKSGEGFTDKYYTRLHCCKGDQSTLIGPVVNKPLRKSLVNMVTEACALQLLQKQLVMIWKVPRYGQTLADRTSPRPSFQF
jgi:hypothetical protein